MNDFLTMVAAFVVANLLTDWIKKRLMPGSVNSQEQQTTDTEPQTYDEYAESLKEGRII